MFTRLRQGLVRVRNRAAETLGFFTGRAFSNAVIRGQMVGVSGLSEIARLIRLGTVSTKLDQPYSQHHAIYTCVTKAARNVASVPFQLVSGSPSDQVVEEDHELNELFLAPNPLMTGNDLWYFTVLYMELAGECFWALEGENGSIQREDEIPKELWPLNPRFIKPIWTEESKKTKMPAGWRYWPPGAEEPEPFELWQIIHFKYPNPEDPLRGQSPLEAAITEARMDQKAKAWDEAFLDNGADPGGTLVTEQSPIEEERKKMRESWEMRHKGPRNANRVALLWGGVKYQPLPAKHVDMQFLGRLKWTREVVCEVYETPPEIAGFGEKTFENQLQAKINYWQHKLSPLTTKLDETLRRWFFLPRFGMDGLQGRHDLSQVDALRQAVRDKLGAARQMLELGYTLNQVNKRLHLDMEEVEWGDTPFAPPNLIPIDQLFFDDPFAPSSPSGGGDSDEGDGDDDEGDGSEGDGSTEEAFRRLMKRRETVLGGRVMESSSFWDTSGEKSRNGDVNGNGLDSRKGSGVSSMVLSTRSRKTVRATSPSKARLWETYIARVFRPNETRMRRIILRHLRGVLRDQLRIIRSNEDAFAKMLKAGVVNRQTFADIERMLFDKEKFDRMLKVRSTPVFADTFVRSVRQIADELGGVFQFDVGSEEAVGFMRELPIKITRINGTLRERFRKEISESIEQNETVDEAAARIQKFSQFSASRSQMIARTETGKAASRARFMVMDSEGVGRGEWVTARDERVRASHSAQDGVVRRRGRAFPNGLVHPNDPAGPPGEVINCRCVLAPVV